jgi:tetratricopeptide (TPR) repeat protein
MRAPALAAALAGILGASLLAPAVEADILHLQGGGVVETDRWWIDGDQLRYEGSSGTVGIPRSIVVRIEKSVPANGSAQPRSSAASAGPAGTLGGSEARGAEIRRLLKEGTEALERKDYAAAMRAFEDAIGMDPSVSQARVGAAVANIALGRDEAALALVLDGLNRDAGCADLHEILGDLRNRQEMVEDALRAWSDAFRIAPNDRLREKITKAERELHAGRGYSFVATPHFNLRHDTEREPGLQSAVEDFLEDKYRELADVFRHAPSQPITVLLYPNQQFRDVTQAPDQVVGLYDGKIRVPLGGLHRLGESAQRVLAHELTHAFVYSLTRGNCPRWLHEGIAQRMEGRTLTRTAGAQVKALLQAGDPAQWTSQPISYPAALSFTLFLEKERGFERIVHLLERLGSGIEAAAAFQEVYSEDIESLSRRWAREVVGGGRP